MGRWMLTVLACLVASVLAAGSPALAAEGKTLRIGWSPWSDAEAITRITAHILEERLGYEVKLERAGLEENYEAVARGKVDLMLMAWLPRLHAPFWDKVKDRVLDLGPLYGPAPLGWVVPAYVPEGTLASMADLAKPDVRRRLKGRIQGLEPGTGMMRVSEQAMKAYGLEDYNLGSSSAAGMAAALGRAVRREEWIVVLGWRPHWMFSRHELRFLDDPKGFFKGTDEIHALARRGFDQDFPRATAFLRAMNINLRDLEWVMLKADTGSYARAARQWVEDNPEKVDAWLEGL